MNLTKYLRVWWVSALLSVQTSLENRAAAGFFIAGKFIRFFFFIIFLTLIHQQVQNVSGFTLEQMVTFFLVFNLFDLFGQLFFRGIYRFRDQIVSGEFDFRLAKPINSLFQALTRHTDILDIPLLVTVIVMLALRVSFTSLSHLALFVVMFIAGALIITAIHIAVAALGVTTTEVDHTIMIYRDLSNMARFPIDIYTQLLRSFLTFVIPIGLAYTYPAKAIMQLISWPSVLMALTIAITVFILSLAYWRHALKYYSSASS